MPFFTQVMSTPTGGQLLGKYFFFLNCLYPKISFFLFLQSSAKQGSSQIRSCPWCLYSNPEGYNGKNGWGKSDSSRLCKLRLLAETPTQIQFKKWRNRLKEARWTTTAAATPATTIRWRPTAEGAKKDKYATRNKSRTTIACEFYYIYLLLIFLIIIFFYLNVIFISWN